MAFHWITGGQDTTWTGPNQSLFTVTNIVPAGGVMKRFQGRSYVIEGRNLTTGANSVGPLHYNIGVSITTGHYAPRQIYTSTRQVPFQVASVYDVLTTQRVYDAYYNGGDDEFGFNQRCDFGKAGYPAMNVVLTHSVQSSLSYTGWSGFFHSFFQFAVLYEL